MSRPTNEAVTGVFRLEPARRTPCCTVDEALPAQIEAELLPWIKEGPTSELHLTLVVPDNTRPAAPHKVLPLLLAALARSVEGADVVVLVGTGLHPEPPPEWLARLRASLDPLDVAPLSVRLECHDPRQAEREGVPISRWVTTRTSGGWADKVITVSVVEPHQYAGFSGGAKAIAIGCGATSTIGSIHSLELLRDPRVQVGNLVDNPFRRRLDEVSAGAAPARGISLIPHPSGEGLSGVVVGADPEAFKRAAELAREALLVPVDRQFDFAIIDVPESKASSFYQASRALTYVGLHHAPCVREGGTLVLRAACPEAYGPGRGEQAFATCLRRGRQTLLDELNGHVAPPPAQGGGAQRAYVLARLTERFTCILVGAPELADAQRLGILQRTTDDALDLRGHGLLIADPFIQLPYFDPLSAMATGGEPI